MRRLAAVRHGRIDVIGHSQGGTLPIYALKFWPDLAGLVEDYVGLAPALTSPATGDVLCLNTCAAPFQQLRSSAQWFAAFSRRALPKGPSYTTIASRTDEIVFPQPTASHLDGASNIVLQDLCPNKTTDHFAMATDGAVWAIAQDALTHDGPADLRRVPVTDCVDPFLPDEDPATGSTYLAQGAAGATQASGGAQQLTHEPPVRCYLRTDCAVPDERGRILASSRITPRGVLRLHVQQSGDVLVTVHAARVRPVTVSVTPGRTAIRLRGLAVGQRVRVTVAARDADYPVWAVERTWRSPVRSR
jgi:hypothetical protein